MKKRIFSGAFILVALLIVTGLLVAQAKATPKATGDVGFESWGMKIQLTFDVKETDPVTHVATGKVTAKAGADYLEYTPICVRFDQQDGKPIAIMVLKITQTNRSVVGTGLVGEYGKWMVLDGGTPGSNGDQWTVQSYQPPTNLETWEDWIEYWPADGEPPSCADFTPHPSDATQNVIEGNLVIHNK
jgi:hypothetical protein